MQPKEFRKNQEKATIHCNRPQDTVKTLTLWLSHPVFGKFLDDCESFKPASKVKEFLGEFLKAMTRVYDVEKDRQTAILKLFLGTDITIQANKVIGTKYMTDGSSFSAGGLLYVLAELKNEVCSTNCEPYLQAALYYLEATRTHASEYLHSNLPCIIVLCSLGLT